MIRACDLGFCVVGEDCPRHDPGDWGTTGGEFLRGFVRGKAGVIFQFVPVARLREPGPRWRNPGPG